MYIDNFIWLPNILDKIEVKHQVSQDEAEEVFSTNRVTASSNRVIKKAKMFIRQAGKPKRVGI